MPINPASIIPYKAIYVIIMTNVIYIITSGFMFMFSIPYIPRLPYIHGGNTQITAYKLINHCLTVVDTFSRHRYSIIYDSFNSFTTIYNTTVITTALIYTYVV